MLLEVYILFQILAVIGLFVILHSDQPVASVLTMLISGVLIVGAWMLNIGTNYVWDSGINAYVAEANMISTPYLAYINMAIFGLALTYFFYDIFMTAANESPKINNVATGKGEGLNKK